MPQDEGEVEVAQKIDAQHLLQTCLESIQTAATPAQACLGLARLYALLGSLRRLDATFESDWAKILDGHLVDVVASRHAWRRLTWAHALAAQEALLDLMDRHGMGLQSALADPIEEELAAKEGELEREVTQSEGEDGTVAARLMEPAAESESEDEEEGESD